MILCENENESGHDERKAKTRRVYRLSAFGLQFIGTAEGLAEPESVPEVGAHLEGVHVGEGLLRHGRQLPQDHAEGPLQQIWDLFRCFMFDILGRDYFVCFILFEDETTVKKKTDIKTSNT